MTGPVAELRAAVAALAQQQAFFVADDREDGWRQRLVQRRCRLQEHIAAVARAWQELERDLGATEAGQQFRRKLIELRAGVAGHQAAWPAVMIDERDPVFVASRDVMRVASAKFHAAAKALLDTLSHPAEEDLPQ